MKKIALVVGLSLALASQASMSAMTAMKDHRISDKKSLSDISPPRSIAIDDHCHSQHFEWMTGKGIDPFRYISKDPTWVRVILPGHSYTMDYVEKRLNFHINHEGRVERVSCG